MEIALANCYKEGFDQYVSYLFIYLIYICHIKYILQKEDEKKITKIAQFTGQEKLQKKEKFKIKCNIK